MLSLPSAIANGLADIAMHGTTDAKFTLAALSVMLVCVVFGIICALVSQIEVEKMEKRRNRPAAPRHARDLRYYGPR